MISITNLPIRWFVLVFCLLSLSACESIFSGKKQPVAKEGVLDLRDWRLETDGAVTLDGEWGFYWENLLDPEVNFEQFQEDAPIYLDVPGIWNGYEVDGRKLTGNGFGTYRLLIQVDPNTGLSALRTLDASSAFTMWVNSKRAAASGRVGTSRDNMIPGYAPRIALVIPKNGVIEVLVQVSNFNYKKGGLWSSIYLGTVPQINELRERNIIIECLLSGSIVIMGFYHLVLFGFRRSDRSSLYFGIFNLTVALRVALTGERLMHQYLPWLSWETMLRLEYLTFYLGAPLFLLFLAVLYRDYSQKPAYIVTVISLLFSAVVIITEPSVFSHTLYYYQYFISISCLYFLVFLVRIILDRKPGAILVVFGSVFLLTTFFYDILISKGIVYSIQIAPVGLFVFIFFQSAMLSIRFSRAHAMAEELSEKLEQKVEQRTRRLQKANREISASHQKLKETQSQLIQSQKMEAMGTLSGGIAHDFNNILGTILGYTELMLNDPELKNPNRSYIGAISRSGERATDLVRQILTFSRGDLQERSQMKLQQPLLDIMGMIGAALSETIEVKINIDPGCGPILANETQISQIVVNLCTNAEYAMKGGIGVLEVELVEVGLNEGDFPEASGLNGRFLKLGVKDTGRGMNEEMLEQIFNPFFSTKGIDEGSGLGLSIVHGIVQNHQGFLRVQSEEGKGALFEVFFPVINE